MFDSLVNQTGISLERLAALCEVAEAGSIGVATKGNANRQSQFSRQIAELEAFFGQELLDRRARPFRLNEAGMELSSLAHTTLSGLEGFLVRCQGGAERLVVGAGESFIQWLLLPLVVRASLQNCWFVFKNLDSKRIIEGLKCGQVDIGLVRANAVEEGFRSVRGFQYTYRLFVPKKLLAKRAPRDSSVLGAVPLAVMEGRGELRAVIESMAASEGTKLSVVMECSSYPQIATAVASGFCAGVLPDFAGRHMPNDTVVVDLGDEAAQKLTRKMCLVWSSRAESMKPSLPVEARRLSERLATGL